MKLSYDTVKRFVDCAAAGVGLIVSLPLQAGLAVLIRRKLGRPVLFRQTRPGIHGTPFTLVKFRSMAEVDEAKGMVTDEQRLTKFGATLRATSLDELPTLWNVVKGDMSLVGPRPLLMEYLPRYTAEQARRHEVRPGITGLAQVSGRNAVPWNERFELDVEYVGDRSAILDVRILWRTIAQVAKRAGISEMGQATMRRFTPRAEA